VERDPGRDRGLEGAEQARGRASRRGLGCLQMVGGFSNVASQWTIFRGPAEVWPRHADRPRAPMPAGCAVSVAPASHCACCAATLCPTRSQPLRRHAHRAHVGRATCAASRPLHLRRTSRACACCAARLCGPPTRRDLFADPSTPPLNPRAGRGARLNSRRFLPASLCVPVSLCEPLPQSEEERSHRGTARTEVQDGAPESPYSGGGTTS
jgi:hypothetical protein